MMLDYKEIGHNIRKYRLARSLKQKDLAEKINMTEQHISHIECIYRRPRATCTEELSQAAGVESQL